MWRTPLKDNVCYVSVRFWKQLTGDKGKDMSHSKTRSVSF